MASYKLEVHQDWTDGQKLDFVQYVCKDVGNQFIDRYVEGIEKARVENGYPYTDNTNMRFTDSMIQRVALFVKLNTTGSKPYKPFPYTLSRRYLICLSQMSYTTDLSNFPETEVLYIRYVSLSTTTHQ